MTKSKWMALSLAASGLLALAGCQKGDAPSTQDTASHGAMDGMDAMGPDAKPGTSASAGRLVLPVVAGRPAGVYFSFTNNSDKEVVLAGVHIDGADSAEMHKTEGGKMSAVERIGVAAGETITFKPGALHVMAFDLDDTLKDGGTSEMTLTFEDGDKISLPLKIETMGAGMGSEATMDHSAHMKMDH